MAKIVKPGTRMQIVFRGKCPSCGAIIEADRKELNVEMCPREHYQFAHFTCLQCGSGMIMYPAKGDSDDQYR